MYLRLQLFFVITILAHSNKRVRDWAFAWKRFRRVIAARPLLYPHLPSARFRLISN